MPTTTLRDDVAAFAAAVRAHLDDLPADEVDDLTDGLESDLLEQAEDDHGALAKTDAEQYAAESALVGPAEHFDLPELSPQQASLRTGRGTPAEEIELLRSARADDPDEPLWSGVTDLQADDGAVQVHFARRYEPHLQPVADSTVQVSCHRYHDPR